MKGKTVGPTQQIRHRTVVEHSPLPNAAVQSTSLALLPLTQASLLAYAIANIGTVAPKELGYRYYSRSTTPTTLSQDFHVAPVKMKGRWWAPNAANEADLSLAQLSPSTSLAFLL